jgi:hypothetical protein
MPKRTFSGRNVNRARNNNVTNVLLSKWPKNTSKLFRSTGADWLMARPKVKGKNAIHPMLLHAGAEFLKTMPDGMYVRLEPKSGIADAICIECCSSLQNLYDKRSRYMSTTSSLVLKCPKQWLNEPLHRNKKRYEYVDELCKLGKLIESDLNFSIRYLRILYVLPRKLYDKWMEHGVPAGHEFFLPQESLTAFNGPSMQEFLARLSPNQQFYTKRH